MDTTDHVTVLPDSTNDAPVEQASPLSSLSSSSCYDQDDDYANHSVTHSEFSPMPMPPSYAHAHLCASSVYFVQPPPPPSTPMFQHQPMPIVQEFFHRQKAENSALHKTRMCKFVMNGLGCPDGAACRFAHSLAEIRNRPNLCNTALCRWYDIRTNTHTCKRHACKYAHSLAELKPDPRYAGYMQPGKFRYLNVAMPYLHNIKRIDGKTYVAVCEHCGKFSRLTPCDVQPSGIQPPFGQVAQLHHNFPN